MEGDLDVQNLLKVIGSAASIIFAAWIFMGSLQARCDAAFERQIDAIKKDRNSDATKWPTSYFKQEIGTYRVVIVAAVVVSGEGLIIYWQPSRRSWDVSDFD